MEKKKSMTIFKKVALAVIGLSMIATAAHAASQTKITIGSWRSDDLAVWQNVLIPAFEKKHPNIKVQFKPTPPAQYNASLNAKLEAGTAPDVITCRPFDASLSLYKAGHLASVNKLGGLKNFSDVAKSAWTTDDGKTTFCVPMASVIHGFIYNKEIFKKVGVSVPKTEAEFFALLKKIKKKSKFTPLVMGTADQWEAATMGFNNVGPNYWKGEKGRKDLISGKAKISDAPYVKTLASLAKWKPYLGRGFQAQGYADSQNLFAFGKGAIYPAGSWDIGFFNKEAKFKMGAFPPPLPKGEKTCYISDHTDIGIGMNAHTKNKKEVETFLNWIASAEFGTLFANALPGFYPLSNHQIKVKDQLANEFLSWRNKCKSTIRNSYQFFSRGKPNLESLIWNASVAAIKGTKTPKKAAMEMQKGLAKWYKPMK